MMEFKDIIKMSRSLLSKGGRGKMTTRSFSSERDWLILLSTAFTIFFIGVGIGVFQLYTYLALPQNIAKEDNTTLPFFSTLSVQSITEEYKEREERFEELLSEESSGNGLPADDVVETEEEAEESANDSGSSPSLSF